MTELSGEQDGSGELHCPACGEAVVAVSPEGLARCARCGEQFLAVATEPGPVLNAGALGYGRAGDDSELSELHIRNISNLRRGAYRSRSYLIIGAAVCFVAAAKLIQIAIVAWRGRLHVVAIGDLICALGAMMIFASIARKIGVLSREIRESRLKDPEDPPDLTHLGDGSQRLRHLEAMAGLKENAATDEGIGGMTDESTA
jgi:hypothetical protein